MYSTLYVYNYKRDFTQEEEGSPPSVPSESPEEKGAQRIRGSKTHHHKANKMDPQSTRHIVLQRNNIYKYILARCL